MDAKTALLKALQEDMQEKVNVVRPHVDAQRMELITRFEGYCVDEKLAPGMFVEEKHGVGYLVAESRPKCVLMLWRMLDLTTFGDRDLVRAWRRQSNIDLPDCVVAMVRDDGGDIITLLHETRRLKRSVS